MQIPVQIRKFAVMIQNETGKSMQEILEAIVGAVKNSVAEFGKEILCPLCGSRLTRVTTTRMGETETVRYHSCDYCSSSFKSIQINPVKIPENNHGNVVYFPKNPHIESSKKKKRRR